MKINLLMLVLLLFLIPFNGVSQYIVAGQTLGKYITYYDCQPDLELNCPPSYGDISESITIDLNKDGINDFKLQTSMGSGVSHTIRTSTITPLGNNQISFSSSQTSYGYYGDSLIVFVAKAYQLGETIQDDSTFTDNQWRAFNYIYSLNGFASCFLSEWVDHGEDFVGFRLISPTDTIYGWMRVYTPSESHLYVRDYAYYDKNNGNQPMLYPNPATNQLIVEISQETTAEIMDIEGKTIISQLLIHSPSSIDVSKLSKGVYHIKLASEEKTEVKSFVKE